MHELDEILEAWRDSAFDHRSAVLATVVHVTGSAYRRPGARMLIFPDGRRIGSISGGCLEGDVCKKAWWLTEGGQPTLRIYDTSSDDDAIWEFGLGCNGVIQVLLERVETSELQKSLQFLTFCRESRQEGVIVTVVQVHSGAGLQAGNRLFADSHGPVGGTLMSSPLAPELMSQARATLHERKSRLVHLSDCDVFVEWIGPPVPLVIFGAGHDVIPLVAIAKQIGWHVTVIDDRPVYAKASRFPSADAVRLSSLHDPLAGVGITADSIVVLMTHNYPQDRKLLPRLLPLRPRYLGLLGPRLRTERLFAELDLGMPSESLHAPVGLDIGSDAPELIALSIVAEIQATLTGRSGSMLKHRVEPIHAPATEVGEQKTPYFQVAEQPTCSL